MGSPVRLMCKTSGGEAWKRAGGNRLPEFLCFAILTVIAIAGLLVTPALGQSLAAQRYLALLDDQLWLADSEGRILARSHPDMGAICAAAFSPDGSRVAVARCDEAGIIRLTDAALNHQYTLNVGKKLGLWIDNLSWLESDLLSFTGHFAASGALYTILRIPRDPAASTIDIAATVAGIGCRPNPGLTLVACIRPDAFESGLPNESGYREFLVQERLSIATQSGETLFLYPPPDSAIYGGDNVILAGPSWTRYGEALAILEGRGDGLFLVVLKQGGGQEFEVMRYPLPSAANFEEVSLEFLNLFEISIQWPDGHWILSLDWPEPGQVQLRLPSAPSPVSIPDTVELQFPGGLRSAAMILDSYPRMGQ